MTKSKMAKRTVLLLTLLVGFAFLLTNILTSPNFFTTYKSKDVYTTGSTMTGSTIVAFGDSNTTGWLQGETPWFTTLQSAFKSLYPNNVYTFQNLAVNGTTVAPSYSQSTGQSLQYNINNALAQISHANLGFIMLGTNDAWEGIPVATFESYYQQLITTIKNSGKVERLYILDVPPMIWPYNCIGSTCWDNSHNPETERVIPFNNFLSSINSYCQSISYTCGYVNSANGIQLNTTYLNSADGIHLLNPGQNTVENNVYNAAKYDHFVMASYDVVYPPLGSKIVPIVLRPIPNKVIIKISPIILSRWWQIKGFK